VRRSVTDVRGVLRDAPPGLLPLVHAAALDVVFVLGVLQASPYPDGRSSAWLGVPALVLALTLPLLLLLTVVVSLTCAPQPAPSRQQTVARLQAATVLLSGLGFVRYLSPWGRAGVAAIVAT
jgi:hypothetical protein